MDLIIVLAKAAADVFITGKSSGRTHSVCAQTFNHPASSRDRHTPNFRNREGLGSIWVILQTCGDGGLALLRIMDEYVGFARSGMGRVSTAINACHSLFNLFECVVKQLDRLGGGFGFNAQSIHDHQVVLDVLTFV